MTINQQIIADLKTAILARDEARKSLLRVILADFSIKGKDITDEQAIKVLRILKEEAIEMNNPHEVFILDEYLPKMLSREETKNVVGKIIKNNNIVSASEIGKIMKAIKKLPDSNLIDRKIVSEVIKEILS